MIEMNMGMRQRGSLAMTPALRQAIGFLTLANAQLSARLADLSAHNAALELTGMPEAGLWPGLMRLIAPPRGGSANLPPPDPAHAGGPGGMISDIIPAADPGLLAHVAAQVPLLVRDRRDGPVVDAFLQVLEPSGWLSESVEQIAARAGCPVARAEQVLRQLQAAEPTGLFARSLAECLALQATEQGLMTPAFATLLDNLPLVGEAAWQELADLCDTDRAGVAAMVGALRRLNPKPGAAFSQAEPPARPPDLVLRRDGAGWLLELNAATLPGLRLNGADAPPEALREARALVQALERRHATVLTIAAAIVARQDGHLRGQAPLAALTINDLAVATGLHRSTVSRVTAALVLAGPRQSWPLRALMAAAAPPARRLEEPLSVAEVLLRMRAIVAAEDSASPLSDADIAAGLLPQGAALARRTVAKYRSLAGIPPRAARRKA